MIASGGVGNAWPTSRLSHAKTHWQPDRRAPCVCSSWIEELASSIWVLEVPLAPMSFCLVACAFSMVLCSPLLTGDLLMTTSPRISFASLNAYEPSLVMYLQQVVSRRLNFPEILRELDPGCPSQCQNIRLAAIWGHWS